MKSFEQKLKEVGELIGRRAAVVEELATIDKELEFMLAGPRPLTVRDKQSEKPNGGKGRPRADREKAQARAYALQKREPCSECGSLRRHFKTCSKNGKETTPSFQNGGGPAIASERSAPPPVSYTPLTKDPLTAEQYGELRQNMLDREFQSARYALTRKLSPREINLAVRSANYQNYLETREV